MSRDGARIANQIRSANHYFAMLGVHRQSTNEEVGLARRALAKFVHPDVNNSPDAGDLMARLNVAHDALTTDREAYVRSLRRKPCAICAGSGIKKRQMGFTRTIITACRACDGAGVL